jgi:hypothetical protein
MYTKQKTIRNVTVMLLALTTVSGGLVFGSEVAASYLYTLSNFTGIVPLSWAKISVDESTDEVAVLYGQTVRLFNTNGMGIYSFNEEGELGFVRDVTVDGNGDIIVLSSRDGVGFEIIRSNYRGEPMSTITLKNLPVEFSGFVPNRIVLRGGSFYLASLRQKMVIVTDEMGVFKDGYDLLSFMELSEKEKEDTNITGFSIDKQGNILFTMPAMGRAGRRSPDRKLQVFGRRGSAPGRFGVPADIVTDASGQYVLVADTLRCVIMIFDSTTFKFKMEFGFRGYGPGNLIGPMFLAVDSKNRVYVSQLRNRGISVYQISES